MTNRDVQYPPRYRMQFNNGEEFIVWLYPEPGEVFEAGTELNKSTLLTDKTAAALGLTSGDPTVNDALAVIAAALSKSVRVAVGSYTGTGTYGQSAPNSLSFDFAPDVVFVFKDSYVPVEVSEDGHGVHYAFSNSFICLLRGGSAVTVRDIYTTTIPGTGNVSYNDVTAMLYTIAGNTASWYFNGRSSSIGSESQMNESSKTYHYIAIGRGQAG